MSLVDLVRARIIEYDEFPAALVGKYQSFTQADLTALRKAGYKSPMKTVDDGVAAYVEWMMAREAPPAVA